jgi:hypothetical protein
VSVPISFHNGHAVPVALYWVERPASSQADPGVERLCATVKPGGSAAQSSFCGHTFRLRFNFAETAENTQKAQSGGPDGTAAAAASSSSDVFMQCTASVESQSYSTVQAVVRKAVISKKEEGAKVDTDAAALTDLTSPELLPQNQHSAATGGRGGGRRPAGATTHAFQDSTSCGICDVCGSDEDDPIHHTNGCPCCVALFTGGGGGGGDGDLAAAAALAEPVANGGDVLRCLTQYESFEVEGFTVMTEPGLVEAEPTLLSEIGRDLIEVAAVVPAAAMPLLRTCRIFFNAQLEFGAPGDLQGGRGMVSPLTVVSVSLSI